jgi:hypothetical protein
MRFFFDYTTRDQSLRDYQGDEFLSSKGAFDFAEATTQTLRSSLNGEWAGWSVEVRDANGTKYFSLPVMPGRPAATERSEEPVQSVKNPSTVLIIEDMPVHGVIIGHIARKVGFVITEVHSYEDACKVVDARQFDCITLDLGLGEHVGLDVLRYLDGPMQGTDYCHQPIRQGRLRRHGGARQSARFERLRLRAEAD